MNSEACAWPTEAHSQPSGRANADRTPREAAERRAHEDRQRRLDLGLGPLLEALVLVVAHEGAEEVLLQALRSPAHAALHVDLGAALDGESARAKRSKRSGLPLALARGPATAAEVHLYSKMPDAALSPGANGSSTRPDLSAPCRSAQRVPAARPARARGSPQGGDFTILSQHGPAASAAAELGEVAAHGDLHTGRGVGVRHQLAGSCART
jgi:hypothetical protein